MATKKELSRERRRARVHSKVKGTSEKPRLIVFRSLTNIYAQLTDDGKKHVIAASSDLKDKSKTQKTEKAKKVGADIAKKAQEKNIKKVVFDRNGYKYHGRVKALAESARENGLEF
ncbi:MAG: 50S ribosomal protein L18 [Candidatus Gracilibacteria bacterium]|jgi:large subunit ribosomal protein L18